MLLKALVAIFAIALIGGCQSNGQPRLRLGAYFGAPLGIYYPDPDHLGKHEYTLGLSEQIGMVYTCRAGFIDIGHLRESADRTAYISRLAYDALIKGETEFSFRTIEPSKYTVTINYPDNWAQLPEKEIIAQDTSIRLGQYFAYMTTLWHEIITWHGYKTTWIFSEYISSFSWEDLYSDLLGTQLATRALRDKERKYNDAMTMLINEELQMLDAQPPRVAISATRKVEGKWYAGGLYFFVTMRKRNFDTGLDDGRITPWLVPGICSDCEVTSCDVPNLDFLSDYGLAVTFAMEPRVQETGRVLMAIYPDGDGKRIEPAVHFPLIVDHIKNSAIKKYGPQVDVPRL